MPVDSKNVQSIYSIYLSVYLVCDILLTQSRIKAIAAWPGVVSNAGRLQTYNQLTG